MQKPGHIKPDCPFLKKSLKKGDQKKKAMITIWDDLESSSSKKKRTSSKYLSNGIFRK